MAKIGYQQRWILGKIEIQKGEFWWKLDFKKVNFDENWTSKRWILVKIGLQKGEFEVKLDF